MTAGLYLLSLLTADTSTGLASLYMFVLGAGIGASMQVLVIAVQNAVSYADLGAGTAGRLSSDQHPQLRALITSITHQLAASDEKPGADLENAA